VVEKLEDILTRFGNKIASDNADDQNRKGQGTKSHPLPDVIRCEISLLPTSSIGSSKTIVIPWST
jgi:hypothetical protein